MDAQKFGAFLAELRKEKGWTLLFGVLALLVPILFCLLLAFAFALGGPVPN